MKSEEERKAKRKEYYQKNKESIKLRSKLRYETKKESILLQNKKWRAANREKVVGYSNKWLDANPEWIMWKNALRRAKELGLPFDIEFTDITIPEYCPTLGIKLKRGHKTSLDSSPSLDRIIPELGYTKDNIKVISLRANRLKNEMDVETLKKIIAYIES